ncbi:MAG: hypothetical protein GY940_48345 [bacterium]|nr:hypothetical protein [bacterium]
MTESETLSATYEPPSEARRLLWLGILFVFITVLLAITTRDIFPVGFALAGTLMWAPIVVWAMKKEIVAVEVLDSGAVRFRKRSGGDSFPVSSLVRVEGSTWVKRHSGGGRATSEGVEFVFEEEDGNGEVKKRVRMKKRDDPAMEMLVRQLETLNPRADISHFRDWRNQEKPGN